MKDNDTDAALAWFVCVIFCAAAFLVGGQVVIGLLLTVIGSLLSLWL